MASQRPLLPILITLYQTARANPLGAQARTFEEDLTREAEATQTDSVPRATQVVALRQAVALGVLRAEGEKRGRRYFSGYEDPSGWTDEVLAERLAALVAQDQEDSGGQGQNLGTTADLRGINPTPKATSGRKPSRKARTQGGTADTADAPSFHSRFKDLQKVVWGIADTLRDKSNLQVDAFRPITLVLLALKRNFDTQASEQRGDGFTADLIKRNGPLLDGGILTPMEFCARVNSHTEVFDPAIFSSGHSDNNKAGVAVMTWKDLVAFPDSADGLRRVEPTTLTLSANPAGKTWFTYTTQAGDLTTLVDELVGLHVADLREAFSAIGLHAALKPVDPNAPRLSNKILRELVTNLESVDLSLEAVPGDVFSDIYMDLLGRFAAGSGKKGGDFFTPTPLVKGAMRFLPLAHLARTLAASPHKRVALADPTAGAFTFLTQAHQAIQDAARAQGLPALDSRQFTLYAEELTPVQAGLGVFNVFFSKLAKRLAPANEKDVVDGRNLSAGGAIGRIVGNSISEYLPKLGQHAGTIDLVLANPPYGVNDYGTEYAQHPAAGDKRWHVGAPTRSEGEWAFVNTVVDLLAPTGKAVVVLPLGVLFRDGGKAFRRFLVEKNWIEGIVALPSNQFLTTQIPVILLILNKDPERGMDGLPRRHGITFINASGDFTKEGKFNHWDQDEAVSTWGVEGLSATDEARWADDLDGWYARREKPGYSGFVSVEKLRDPRNDYNLSVNRYFAPIKEQVIRDPAALAADVSEIKARLTRRAAWFDGGSPVETHATNNTSGTPAGLWAQAIAARAAGDGGGSNDEPGEPS